MTDHIIDIRHSNGTKTIKCPICGEPYVIYMHYAGDQSACWKCREKAREQK